jgi:uncharacterized membrane protein YfhO
MTGKKLGKKSPPPAKSITKERTVKSDALLFEKYFNGSKGLYFFVGLAVFIGVIVFWNYLTFKNLYLFKDIGSDTVNFSLPQFVYIHDYLRSDGMPAWSFNQGMGQNIFPFIVRDPFDFILYAMDKNSLPYGIIYVEFIKIILGGTFFFLFLRTIRMSTFVSIVGGLIFSFCGFMILGSGWYIFTYEAMCASLLLYAFERFFIYNKWVLFPVAIFLISASMPFNLYLYGLFLAIYAGIRYFEEKDSFQLKEFLGLYGKLILFGLFGLAISSVFLFENVLQLIESPRGSGGNSYFDILSSAPLFATGNVEHNATAILRLFSSDLLGSGSDFKGWHNYLEAPIFYSGLLSLVVFPQVFPLLSKRKKIIYSIFFLIWILPVVFPYFRYAFWLFTGDYYRGFSFFVSLTIIYLTVRALNAIEVAGRINLPVLIATVVILFVLLIYPYYDNTVADPIDRSVMTFIKIILVVYAILVYAMSQKSMKGAAQVLILIVLCIELGYLSGLTVNRRSIVTTRELNQKIGYNDYSVESVDFLKKVDQSFYRIDKNYYSTPAIHGSLNDGLAQDYYGTSSYHSFNQKNYILFQQAFDIIHKDNENESRWAPGLRGRFALESLGSVKYIFYVEDNSQYRNVLKASADSIAQFGDVTVFKNKFYLPLGFAYDKVITRSEFDKLSFNQKDFVALRSFVIDDKDKNDYKDFIPFDLKDTLPLSGYTWDVFKSFTDERKKDTLQISEHGQTFIKGTITLDKKQLLFFSIPFDKGWKATVDGNEQELKLVDAGLTGIILDKGKHTVELNFKPRHRTETVLISFVSLGLFGFLSWRKFRKKQHPG